MKKQPNIKGAVGTSPKVIGELRRIAKKSGGLLLPEKVVDAARSEVSALHRMFCWDDTEAAHQYRLWQARALIRTTVSYVEAAGDKRPVRVFVSLTPDREEAGGGYRETVAVLADKDMRKQLLEDALDELRIFEKKYAHLSELARVFTASRKVREDLYSGWGERKAA